MKLIRSNPSFAIHYRTAPCSLLRIVSWTPRSLLRQQDVAARCGAVCQSECLCRATRDDVLWLRKFKSSKFKLISEPFVKEIVFYCAHATFPNLYDRMPKSTITIILKFKFKIYVGFFKNTKLLKYFWYNVYIFFKTIIFVSKRTTS